MKNLTCVDATLGGNCVTSGGEQFCDDGGFEAFLNVELKEKINYCLFFVSKFNGVISIIAISSDHKKVCKVQRKKSELVPRKKTSVSGFQPTSFCKNSWNQTVCAHFFRFRRINLIKNRENVLSQVSSFNSS